MMHKRVLPHFLLLTLLLVNPAYADTGKESLTESDTQRELTVEDFFRESAITNVALSPDGKTVAYTEYRRIFVGDPVSGFELITIYRADEAIRDLSWSGNNVLVVEGEDVATGQLIFDVLKIAHNESYKLVGHKEHRREGYILDPLVDEPDYIIFCRFRDAGKARYADVYKINLFEGINSQTQKRHRLNTSMDKASFFVLNRDYKPMLGLGYDNGIPHLYARHKKRKAVWETIWSGAVDTKFYPVALSGDGETLWALSNTTTDRVAAVEFAVSEAKVARTLYEHDTYDLIDIEFTDGDTRPTGVSFLQDGRRQYEFFEANDKNTLEHLQRLLPGEQIHVLGVSRDHSIFLIGTTSAKNPLSYYLCKPVEENCESFGSAQPWLDGANLAETLTLRTAAPDGLELTSFLTLPGNAAETVPLVVIPHGGPIGVQDTSYYSGEVQWLARNGYAVLQVDYRGSGGYGKRFENAGLRQWGRGIEDDIEAALANALSHHPVLDENRIGIYGTSYGGYSALQSIIRNPQTYQCAASFAGVTDLTLLFNRSEVRSNTRLRNTLVKIVGDPNIDKQDLIQHSPVYNYKDIGKPVFIAHGTADSIVDIEHSWRLKGMLDLTEAEVDFHIFDGMNHGFETTRDAKALYDPLVEFLDKHLK